MFNEKTKNEFRKLTKPKLIIMCLALLLPVILLIILQLANREFEMDAHIVVFRYIIMALFEIYILSKVLKYSRIMLDDTYCRICCVRLRDERLVYLRNRAYNMAYKIMLFAIGIVLIVSCYYSKEIFYVTLSFLLMLTGTYNIALIYYKKKY